MRTLLLILLVPCLAVAAQEYEVDGDLRLQLKRIVARPECWPVNYSRYEEQWAAAGGMLLSEYITDVPGDYVVGQVFADTACVLTCPVFWYDDRAVEVLEVLSTSGPQQMELWSSNKGILFDDGSFRTRSGGLMLMFRCPPGSVPELPDSVTWNGGVKCDGF